jgi:uncharacterized membrane protein YecN with MAPEG domain
VLELDSGIDLLPATVRYSSTQPGVAATRGIILMKMLMLQMMWANTIMIHICCHVNYCANLVCVVMQNN